MTKLFEEYELKKLAKENAQELIGKKFYWSQFLDIPIVYKNSNKFIITGIQLYPTSHTPLITYEYCDAPGWGLPLH